jgi:uroporphyrinogen decarboxylase
MTISHLERLKACLQDDPAMDRLPIALWRHFPVDDQAPGTLAAATLAFQREFDFDLVKVTPASSFSLLDWGAEDVWEGNTEGTRRYTRRVIEKPQDWERLRVLDPRKARHLAGQINCLKMIKNKLDPETPFIQTVFNPLAQAKNLAGGDNLIVHIRKYPEAVLKGLTTIAKTTRQFVEACLETGIDGVFFANQHAQSGLLTLEEYIKFGLPNDLNILEPAHQLWCNILHLHGNSIYFELARKMPCQIVNWHDRETGPSLADAQNDFSGALCGGLSVETMVYGSPSEVLKESKDAVHQTRRHKTILGTGCVIPVITPYGNIMAARQSVEGPG